MARGRSVSLRERNDLTAHRHTFDQIVIGDSLISGVREVITTTLMQQGQTDPVSARAIMVALETALGTIPALFLNNGVLPEGEEPAVNPFADLALSLYNSIKGAVLDSVGSGGDYDVAALNTAILSVGTQVNTIAASILGITDDLNGKMDSGASVTQGQVTGLDDSLAGITTTLAGAQTITDVTGNVITFANVGSADTPVVSRVIYAAAGTYSKTEVDAALATKAAITHQHAIADVTGLQSSLDAKLDVSATAADILISTGGTQHDVNNDLASSITTLDNNSAAGDAALDLRVGVLETAAPGYAPASHLHTIAEVTGLQAALNTKLETVSAAEVTTDVADPNNQPTGTLTQKQINTELLADVSTLTGEVSTLQTATAASELQIQANTTEMQTANTTLLGKLTIPTAANLLDGSTVGTGQTDGNDNPVSNTAMWYQNQVNLLGFQQSLQEDDGRLLVLEAAPPAHTHTSDDITVNANTLTTVLDAFTLSLASNTTDIASNTASIATVQTTATAAANAATAAQTALDGHIAGPHAELSANVDANADYIQTNTASIATVQSSLISKADKNGDIGESFSALNLNASGDLVFSNGASISSAFSNNRLTLYGDCTFTGNVTMGSGTYLNVMHELEAVKLYVHENLWISNQIMNTSSGLSYTNVTGLNTDTNQDLHVLKDPGNGPNHVLHPQLPLNAHAKVVADDFLLISGTAPYATTSVAAQFGVVLTTATAAANAATAAHTALDGHIAGPHAELSANVDANADYIQTNTASIATVQAAVAANTTNIASNTSDIASNAANITTKSSSTEVDTKIDLAFQNEIAGGKVRDYLDLAFLGPVTNRAVTEAKNNHDNSLNALGGRVTTLEGQSAAIAANTTTSAQFSFDMQSGGRIFDLLFGTDNNADGTNIYDFDSQWSDGLLKNGLLHQTDLNNISNAQINGLMTRLNMRLGVSYTDEVNYSDITYSTLDTIESDLSTCVRTDTLDQTIDGDVTIGGTTGNQVKIYSQGSSVRLKHTATSQYALLQTSSGLTSVNGSLHTYLRVDGVQKLRITANNHSHYSTSISFLHEGPTNAAEANKLVNGKAGELGTNGKWNFYTQFVYYGGSVNASDDRLKINERPITDALQTIRQLAPQQYTRVAREGETTGYEEAGLIAQQVDAIPELRYTVARPESETSTDPVTGETRTNYLALDYDSIMVHSLKALQELDAIVQAQATTIAALQSRLDAL